MEKNPPKQNSSGLLKGILTTVLVSAVYMLLIPGDAIEKVNDVH